MCSFCRCLSALHLIYLLNDEVSELGRILGWDLTSLAHNQVVDLHEPILSELIHIELDLHLKKVIACRILQIEADDVAEFQAVLQRLLGFELRVVVHAELTEVKVDVAIERHRRLFLGELAKFRRFHIFEARCKEFKGPKLADTELCHGSQGYAPHRLPILVVLPSPTINSVPVGFRDDLIRAYTLFPSDAFLEAYDERVALSVELLDGFSDRGGDRHRCSTLWFPLLVFSANLGLATN